MDKNKVPKELNKFYESLDKIRLLHSWKISRELDYSEDIDGEWEKSLIAERKLLTYNISDGKLTSSFTNTDSNGNPIPLKFSKEEIDYFKSRINLITNKWLISKYAHIIWQQSKHNNFAKIALDNYLIIINELNKEEMHQQPVMLSAIIHISKKIKTREEEVKELVMHLIKNETLGLKYRNLKLALDYNLFDKEKLFDIASDLPNWIDQKLISYFTNRDLLRLGLKLYHKLGLNNSILYELLAENEHIILDQHEEDTDFLKYQTNGVIAKYLSLAGKTDESEKYYKEYTRLKKTIKLSNIRSELEERDNELFNDYLNIRCESILESDSDEILSYFSMITDVLVDPKEIIATTEKNIPQSLTNLFSTTVFDINVNFKELEDSDKFSNEWIKNYAISHAVKCEALFIKTFVNGVLRGKLNYFKIYDYLEKYSWYGIKFHKPMTGNESDLETSWLTMLAPGIHNLFAQFEMSVLLNSSKINNFILAIDSLTLKFEGALRDFVLLSDGTTTKMKDGDLKEQLLEDLLNNPKVIEYFGDRDLELFKYTFTNKGRNIRNNVAHCFYPFSNYTLQTALLVFLCILRLGKYNLNKKTSS